MRLKFGLSASEDLGLFAGLGIRGLGLRASLRIWKAVSGNIDESECAVGVSGGRLLEI